jgi:hypothetical protein
MRRCITSVIGYLLLGSVYAQEKNSLTIYIEKKNFKEDTLSTAIISSIQLLKKSRVSDSSDIVYFTPNDIQTLNDSIKRILTISPGIYFLKLYSKNPRLRFSYYPERIVVCSGCNATIKLTAQYYPEGKKVEDDENRIYMDVILPDLDKVFWKANNGFFSFQKSNYLDSIQHDFASVLSRRERRKIKKVNFTVQAFLTADKQISDIAILPDSIDINLKAIITKGFQHIDFWKQYLPNNHVTDIRKNNFSGDKITMTSKELIIK